MTLALATCAQLATQTTLPQGLIHGDLFPDNTLFIGDQLTGLVDFFSGGDGFFGFDLAVAVNAWCSDHRGDLAEPLTKALLTGNQQVRPLCPAERAQWQDFLVVAATRFWVSRRASQLAGSTQPDDSAYRKAKDPDTYRRILQTHLQHRQQRQGMQL